LDRFDALILKIIFKNKKNIILIYFGMKSTLKSNYNYIFKQIFKQVLNKYWCGLIIIFLLCCDFFLEIIVYIQNDF